MKRFSKFRLLLLALGILAIVGLTGMNIYSLYALHDNTVSATVEKHKRQLEELATATRSRFHQSVRELWRIDMDKFRETLDAGEPFPDDFVEIMNRAVQDPLFEKVYFLDANDEICGTPSNVLEFCDTENLFTLVENPDDVICDGFSMARTRMRVLIQEYKWNTRVIHDSHRTMTIVMFNPIDREIVGYILVAINEEYAINEFLAPEIMARFGTLEESGVVVWLDDWTKRNVLISNGPESITRERPDYIQRFPNMLEDWHLRITFMETPEVIASRASLYRNLFLLGGGVFLLLGSLLFMYITAQKERELGMRQASFLANVTHELKTPLAVMQAAGENLADGRVTTTDRLQSYGKHIYTESLRLRRMIEKLLDVAKNEAGQLNLKPIASEMSELVKDYIYEHEAFLNSKNIDIDLQIADNTPQIKVDQNSFHTILGNLVENAIKYSPQSKYLGIRIFSDNKNVYLQVIDKGTGIPKQNQKLIFDKFYRVEDTLTAHTKGHGLGLAIVKNLTERNNGVISVESQYGKGSTFTVAFPAYVAEKKNVTKQERTDEFKSQEYVV
jgi:signal transduction histidine kinase